MDSYKHCDELFTFLDDPAVPADHNGTERDIRSLAAARSDGGAHRADWSATAFARLKSVMVTGMKNQVRFASAGRCSLSIPKEWICSNAGRTSRSCGISGPILTIAAAELAAHSSEPLRRGLEHVVACKSRWKLRISTSPLAIST